MNETLVLRDIHQPAAPSWWPPAPGWWVLAVILIGLAAVPAWRAWSRARRHRALAALFDRTVHDAVTPVAQVAAMSDLLRRAARRHVPHADTLLGEDWLRVLDEGAPTTPGFLDGPGRVLVDGAYRRDLDAQAVEALRPLARARFLAWMQT